MATPKLLILGSAAAEGIPAFFCTCPVCTHAIEAGGRDVRQRTSYNIGGALQIDFGPDIFQAFLRHPAELRAMRHLLVTHAHDDHFAPSQLLYRCGGFCRQIVNGDRPLTVHGTRPTCDILLRPDMDRGAPRPMTREEILDRARIAVHEIAAFQTFDLPDISTTVRTFAANHAPHLDALVFLVTMRGRTFFVCNDTALLPDATFDALKALSGQVRIDVAVLDNTYMLHDGHISHMGMPLVLETFSRLESFGLVDGDTVRVVNHFSHNGGSTHAELEAFYAPRGIVVGHDDLAL